MSYIRLMLRPLALILALLLAACSGDLTETAPLNPHAERDLAAVRLDPDTATTMLNGYRATLGLNPVRLDPGLVIVAQRQADAMVAANKMSHDVAGPFPSRLAAAGVSSGEAGENIGAGYYTLAEAMAAWKHSPGHDANLRIASATRFGIAIAKDPSTHYGAYWAMAVAAEPPALATK